MFGSSQQEEIKCVYTRTTFQRYSKKQYINKVTGEFDSTTRASKMQPYSSFRINSTILLNLRENTRMMIIYCSVSMFMASRHTKSKQYVDI